MSRTPPGWDDPAADPIPYIRGLERLIPEGRLAAILSRTGRASVRRCCRPADCVAWLVIAMALFAADSIPKARRRLGAAPLRPLFLEAARPMAAHQSVGAFYRGWRKMGIDGTTLDLPDTPEDARAFGRPTGGRAAGASPQVRLPGLCEPGTHAVCGPAIEPIRHGEPAMVGPLLADLGPGDLLIWDRGFFGYELVDSALRRGAHLLARARSNSVLRPIRRLGDGSYLAELYPSPSDRRHDTRGLVVRVVEYTHDGPNRPGAGERHRLITDLTNPEDLPAAEAPLVYHERWEEETCQADRTSSGRWCGTPGAGCDRHRRAA